MPGNEHQPKEVKPSKNFHPTVKSVKLMSYLINMITPPEGIVLDPFMGSGSTGVAAIKNNFNFIGIEKETEYMEIAKARIEYAKNNT
jgi:site-specific DNA-methyltransferase (adenine-specific)